MLYFQGGLNRAHCCHQGLCSECFVQICPRPNKAVRWELRTGTRGRWQRLASDR